MTQNDPQWPTAIQSKVYSDPQRVTMIQIKSKNPTVMQNDPIQFTAAHYDPQQSKKIQYILQMP